MAINALSLDNFLGKTATHRFGKANRILGANGVGKSSIKEAICFVFTGCDSFGNRNPQHLISVGQHNSKVTVTTDRAEISRTITRNGNGTLKVIKAGISQTLTQSELEALIAPINVFLSTFIPGFFLKLSSEKQHQVLSDLLPKTPKEETLKDITGIDLSAEEMLRWGVRLKRVDIVANSVAVDRRELEKQRDQILGEVKVYSSVQVRPEPVSPQVEVAKLEEFKSIFAQWKWYRQALSDFEERNHQIHTDISYNSRNETMRTNLTDQIGKIVTSDLLAVPDHSAKISELLAQKLPLPNPPPLFNIIDSDHCPTCGQTVGLKHREKTQEHNQREKEAYEKDLAYAKAANLEVDKAVAILRDEVRVANEKNAQIQESNRKLTAQKHALEIQLAGIVNKKIQEPLEAPKGPTQPEPSQDEYKAVSKIIEAYKTSMVKYEHEKKLAAEAGDKILQCNATLENLWTMVNRLKQIEDGLKKIPQEEMRRQVEALKMDAVQLTVADSIVVTKGGIHYDHLSTGQRMSADLQICRKFNSLMSRPLNLIFLDNADLVDSFDWGDTQMFAAFVDVTKAEVVIEENTVL